jgi:hypothetical protein
MSTEDEIDWSGPGRWLSFASSGLMILIAVPFVFDQGQGAIAGWNIFLGLLLFGAVASGNKEAPLIATIIAVLMVVRLLSLFVIGWDTFGALTTLAVLAVVGGAAYYLRVQVRSA